MGELILHIGMPKTGTSSLQLFLRRNREILAEHGVSFPLFKKQPRVTLSRNAFFLNLYCFNISEGKEPNSGIENLEGSLKKLSTLLGSNERVVLSDETIYNNSNRFHGTANPYWNTMARILGEAEVGDITAIVYLRRQDDWASSHWRQCAKAGLGSDTLAGYLSNPLTLRRMDYANTIEAAEQGLGGATRIMVRRYDRTVFEGGDIYRDFCSTAGIPWDDKYLLPKSDTNTSLSFDVAEALRAFKDVAPPKSSLRMNTLIPLARKLSSENPDAPGTTPFDEERTYELMEPYLEGNRRISEKYLDGDPLFSEEYGGRPVWIPNEERIAECRAAFNHAIRQHERKSSSKGILRALANRLPENVRCFVRSIK